MTYEEAKKRFNLRAHDSVNIESARRYLNHDQRLLKGNLTSEMREEINTDIEALNILLAHEN